MEPDQDADRKFQCSSASRKFLNQERRVWGVPRHRRFSALQRAENSSIAGAACAGAGSVERFSALQRAENSSICSGVCRATMINEVSVLFSEPKIPQLSRTNVLRRSEAECFSALQRAENSSIPSVD